jgi:hypothetical protein
MSQFDAVHKSNLGLPLVIEFRNKAWVNERTTPFGYMVLFQSMNWKPEVSILISDMTDV